MRGLCPRCFEVVCECARNLERQRRRPVEGIDYASLVATPAEPVAFAKGAVVVDVARAASKFATGLGLMEYEAQITPSVAASFDTIVLVWHGVVIAAKPVGYEINLIPGDSFVLSGHIEDAQGAIAKFTWERDMPDVDVTSFSSWND